MSLFGLWELSIVLATGSLIIMTGLIVARIFAEQRAKRFKSRRAELLPRLLSGNIEGSGLLNGDQADSLTTDMLIELIGMLRGDERDEFVALAERVSADKRLISRLRRGSARAKVSAAEALTNFRDATATDALDQALDDNSRDVRLAAALALCRSNRAPPIRHLIRRLSLGRAENSLLLITLLQHVASNHPEEAEHLLIDFNIPPVVKAAAIDALAASGSFHLAPVINQLAISADPLSDELARYLRALGELRHPAGIPAVMHHLDAPTWWVRAAAAEAAGRIGIRDAIVRLIELLDDENWWVRFRAGEALSSLGSDGLVQLRAATKSPSARTASAARLTLSELGLASHA